MSACPHADDLGAYVLGRATVEEQRAVEHHLEGCESCRREVEELEPVSVLLGLADETVGVLPTAVPPPRPRAGRLRTAALAAAIAAAAGVAVGVAVANGGSGPAEATTIRLTAPAGAPATGASGTASVVRSDTGAAVRLRLDNLPPGARWYDCRWVTPTYTASGGTFRAPADGHVDVRLNVATASPAPGVAPRWRIEIVPYDERGTAGPPVLVAEA